MPYLITDVYDLIRQRLFFFNFQKQINIKVENYENMSVHISNHQCVKKDCELNWNIENQKEKTETVWIYKENGNKKTTKNDNW